MKRINGPTPAGGSYSEARAFDASGVEIDDFVAATYVRIDECAPDGTVLLRTHAGHIVDRVEDQNTVAAATETTGEANDPYNTDLTKEVWDVRRAGDQALVEDLADLVETLFPGRPDDQALRRDLAAFTVVPAFQAAPEKLRRQVQEFIAG